MNTRSSPRERVVTAQMITPPKSKSKQKQRMRLQKQQQQQLQSQQSQQSTNGKESMSMSHFQQLNTSTSPTSIIQSQSSMQSPNHHSNSHSKPILRKSRGVLFDSSNSNGNGNSNGSSWALPSNGRDKQSSQGRIQRSKSPSTSRSSLRSRSLMDVHHSDPVIVSPPSSKSTSKSSTTSNSSPNASPSPSPSPSASPWRNSGIAERRRLLSEDDANGGCDFTIHHNCPLRNYCGIANRVQDQFQSAYRSAAASPSNFNSSSTSSSSDLRSTYIMGHRLLKFLSVVLPTHRHYHSPRPECTRLRIQISTNEQNVRRQVDHVAFLLDREIYLSRGRGRNMGSGGGNDVNRSREEERSFEEEEHDYRNYTVESQPQPQPQAPSSYFPSPPESNRNARIRQHQRNRPRKRVVRFSEEVIEYTPPTASTFDPYYSHGNSNSYGSGKKYTATTRKLFKDDDKVQVQAEPLEDVDEFGNAHGNTDLEDWNHKDPSTRMDILDLSFESDNDNGDDVNVNVTGEDNEQEQEPDSSFETYFSDLSINASMNVSISPVRDPSKKGVSDKEDLEELERALQDEHEHEHENDATTSLGAGARAGAENVIGFSDFNNADFNINANHPEDFFANTGVDDGWEHFGSGSNSNTNTGGGDGRVEGSDTGAFDEMEWPDMNDMHMHMDMHYHEDEPSSEYEHSGYEHEHEHDDISGEKSNETSVTGSESESNSEGISLSISATSSDSAYSYSYEHSSHGQESSHELEHEHEDEHEVSHNSSSGSLSSSMWEHEHDNDTSHNTSSDSMDRGGGYIHRGDVDEYIYDHDDEDVDIDEYGLSPEHAHAHEDEHDDDDFLNDHQHEVPTQSLRPAGPIPICVSEMERSMDMIMEESYEEDDSFEVETDRNDHEETNHLNQSSIVYDVDEEIDSIGIGIGMDSAGNEEKVEHTSKKLNLDVSNSRSSTSSHSNGDDDLSVSSSTSSDEHISHETDRNGDDDDSDLESGVSFDSEDDDERSISFEVDEHDHENENENNVSFVEKIARENYVRAIHDLQEGGDDDSAADSWAQEEQFQHKQQQQHLQQNCDAYVEEDHDHCDNDYFAQRGDMKTDFRTPMEVEEALRASVGVSTASDHSHSHHRIRSAASASADVDVDVPRNLIEEPVINLYPGEEKKEQHRHGHRRSRSPSSKISDLNAFMADTSLHGEAISLDYSSSLDFSFTSSKNHLSVSDEWDSTEIELEAPGDSPVDADVEVNDEDFDHSIIAESPEDFRFEEDCQSDDGDTEHTEYVSKMTELEFHDDDEDDTDETLSDPCDSSGGDKTITTTSTADTGGMTSGSDHSSSSDHGETSCKKGIPDIASTEPQKKIGDELDLLESKMKELKEKKENMAREALPEEDSSHIYNENARERRQLRVDTPAPILMQSRIDSQNRTSVKSMMQLSSSVPSLVDRPSKHHQAEETSEQRGVNNLSRRMHPTAARLKVLKQSAAWKRRHARQSKD